MKQLIVVAAALVMIVCALVRPTCATPQVARPKPVEVEESREAASPEAQAKREEPVVEAAGIVVEAAPEPRPRRAFLRRR